MSIASKRLLLRSKSGSLGHRVLQYIEPKGGSYFNTGYYPSSTTSVEYNMAYLTHNIYRLDVFLFGSRASTTSADQFVVYVRHGTPMEKYNEMTAKFGSWALVKQYVPESMFPQSAKDIKLGNTGFDFYGNYISSSPTSYFKCQYPMYIFTINQGGSPHSYYCNALRFYGFKIYENSVLKHDYIPVLKNSAVCLYDDVTNVYLPLLGSNSVGFA